MSELRRSFRIIAKVSHDEQHVAERLNLDCCITVSKGQSSSDQSHHAELSHAAAAEDSNSSRLVHHVSQRQHAEHAEDADDETDTAASAEPHLQLRTRLHPQDPRLEHLATAAEYPHRFNTRPEGNPDQVGGAAVSCSSSAAPAQPARCK
jgi:hypothetical protein